MNGDGSVPYLKFYFILSFTTSDFQVRIRRKILYEKNMNLAECDSTAGYTKSILCHAVKSSLCNLHALDTMS